MTLSVTRFARSSPEPDLHWHSGSGLLLCLRGAGRRLRPSVARHENGAGCRGRWWRALRVFGSLGDVPLWIPKRVRFFLPSVPHKQSKEEAVVDELTDAGIPASAIWTPKAHPMHRVLSRAIRTAWRLPRALSVLCHVRRRSRRLDAIDLRIILGRDAARRLVRRHREVRWIVLSDVSPELHMLWSGALAVAGHVVWWQDDFHHGGQASLSLPYPVQAAAILNDAGHTLVRQRAPRALRLRRRHVSVSAVKPIPAHARVGVAVNALFAGTPTQIAMLDSLRARLGATTLHLRLHPNSTVDQASLSAGWLQIAPQAQSLADYARDIDVAVVGNSAVQLRLLTMGVPVIHVPGLDDHGYDAYGYVRSGDVWGVQTIADLDLAGVAAFYARGLSDSAIAMLTLSEAQDLQPLARIR